LNYPDANRLVFNTERILLIVDLDHHQEEVLGIDHFLFIRTTH